MRDNDNSFNWTGTQQSNGFSRSKSGDDPRCVIMDWNNDENGYYSINIPIFADTAAFEYLSFRACQGTRHPNTDLLNSGLSFQVSLVDGSVNIASVSTASYGLINQPYQRGGGWANEFGTVIIRLSDFAINNSDFHLNELVTIRFDYGNSFNSETGRLAIDDVELIGEKETFMVPFTTNINLIRQNSDVLVFPNPVTEILIIRGLKRDAEIYIANSLGQTIEIIPNIGYEVLYPMEKLESGTYFLYILSNEEHLIKRVIKL